MPTQQLGLAFGCLNPTQLEPYPATLLIRKRHCLANIGMPC